MIGATCFPTIIPTQKRTLPARQKKCPDTPAHLTQPSKQNKKAQITGQFVTTSLPNFALTSQPHHSNTTFTLEKNKAQQTRKPQIYTSKTLLNYKSRMAVPYSLAG